MPSSSTSILYFTDKAPLFCCLDWKNEEGHFPSFGIFENKFPAIKIGMCFLDRHDNFEFGQVDSKIKK